MADATLGLCRNCGQQLNGLFCSQCGQRRVAGPHTFSSLLGSVVERFAAFDSGLPYTMLLLTRQPGRAIRDYLGGRTRPYTHPFAYFLLMMAAAELAARLLFQGQLGDSRVFLFSSVFVVAMVSRIVFRRTSRSYVDHLIMDAYLLGHAALLAVLAQVLMWVTGNYLSGIIAVGLLLGTIGYWAWAYAGVFSERRIRAALGGLLSFGLGFGVWAALLLAVVRLGQYLR